jgi:hypothetical protein
VHQSRRASTWSVSWPDLQNGCAPEWKHQANNAPGTITPQITVGHMSATVEHLTLRVPTPLVDSSLGMKLLPTLLSVTAGSVDTIRFVGLGGLFTAHVTGNLVILAAHLVSGEEAPVAPMLSVPVFMAALGMTRLLAGGLELAGHASLRPLLLLQFLLLAGFLLCLAAGPRIEPSGAKAILAGMLSVSAMAVQKRSRADLAERRAVYRRYNDQHHAFRDGCRRNDAWTRAGGRRQGAKPGDAYMATYRRIRRRLRPWGGMRGNNRPSIPGAARRARATIARNGDHR